MASEILNVTPPSGDFVEIHFGEHFDSCLWVKFTDRNAEEWVGCFPKIYKTLDLALTDYENETAFIVSGGHGYLIDVFKRELIYETDEMPAIESAIVTTNPEYYVVGACYSIFILNRKGLIKRIEPELVDGIYFLEQSGNKASGHLYSGMYGDMNVAFEMDLNTFALQIIEEIKYRQVGLFNFIKV